MTHFDLYQEQDRVFLEAHACAQQLLKDGDIRAFSSHYHSTTGRVIDIQTESGWQTMFMEIDIIRDPGYYY